MKNEEGRMKNFSSIHEEKAFTLHSSFFIHNSSLKL